MECPGCGAPLRPGSGVARCDYCGRETRVGPDPPPPAQRHEPASPAFRTDVRPPPAPPRMDWSHHERIFRGARRMAWIWALLGIGVAVVAVLPALRMMPGAGVVRGLTWDGKSTLRCAGNDSLSVEDKVVSLAGTAVIAGGNCDLTLTRCFITADVAIEAGGNATVHVEGGRIEGRTRSIDAEGNADVKVRGAEIVGRTRERGNAHIDR